MKKTDNSVILGMDSTNHLLDWFSARGQKFIVIHIPTVLSMPQLDRAAFLLFLYDFHLRDSMPDLSPVDGHRRELQQLAFREYFLICLEDLRKFPIDLLDMFQRWILKYRDQRQTTNLIEDECSCKKNKRCLTCEGTGKVLVFVEMNPIEALLSEGKTWDEIDRQLEENSKKDPPNTNAVSSEWFKINQYKRVRIEFAKMEIAEGKLLKWDPYSVLIEENEKHILVCKAPGMIFRAV